MATNKWSLCVSFRAAIATASVKDGDGEDQTFAIMCVETADGWKIAALLAP